MSDASQNVRSEPRPCAVCGKAILPGFLYVAEGPAHVVCKPPARLDVQRVAQAARATR